MPAGAAYYWITGLFGFVVLVIMAFMLGVISSIVYNVWINFNDAWRGAGFETNPHAKDIFDSGFSWLLTAIRFSILIGLVGLVLYIIVNSARRERFPIDEFG